MSEGAYVTSSSSVIAKLTKISPLKIEFSIPESYAAEVQDGTPILFRMEKNGMMQNYKATVYAVESKVDMATRTGREYLTRPLYLRRDQQAGDQGRFSHPQRGRYPRDGKRHRLLI
mgnify:CR=1 FL=1